MGKNLIKSIASISLLTLLLTSCSGTRPTDLGPIVTQSTGVETKTLSPCPETPNCITSFLHNNDEGHYLEKLSYTGSRDEVISKIKAFTKSKQNIKIVKSSDVYIYMEWTSQVMKFVDDVELLFNVEGVIHFRAASRIGRKDFGVNKEHIEELKKVL